MKKSFLVTLSALFLIVFVLLYCSQSLALQIRFGDISDYVPKTDEEDDQYLQFDNFRYVIEENEVTIKGYVTAPSGEIIIPEEIDGLPVTCIGDEAFLKCEPQNKSAG